VALSTAEAEYMAAADACKEVLWLKTILLEIGIDAKTPIVLQEDNQACIKMAKNPVFHKRTKHIDVRYHFVRQTVRNGDIKFRYCPTDEMVADILTKPLQKAKFTTLAMKILQDCTPTQHTNTD
jgi:hypothetical protein